MIRINFCKTGASISDWDIEDKVQFVKTRIELSAKSLIQSDIIYNFSNFLLFDALRAEIAEGKISLDNICFSVDDVPLEVNRYGATPNGYPKQGESACNYSTRVLIAAMNLRKKEDEDRYMAKYGVKTFKEVAELKKREKEESSNLAKAPEEGQAPVPTGESDSSRES